MTDEEIEKLVDKLTARIHAFNNLLTELEPRAAAASTPREFSDVLTSGLNDQQAKSIEVLDWIVMGGRGTGRTHALAVHAIRSAACRQGTRFEVFDHYSRESTRRVLWPLIKRLLSFNSDVSSRFRLNDRDLSITCVAMSAGDPAQKV